MHSVQLLLASAGLATAIPTFASLNKRGNCSPNPAGISGYDYTPDSASGFEGNGDFSSAAAVAPTPTGYTNVFTGLQASNNANDYRGYSLLSSYDPAQCAANCNADPACQSFNLFFERDPSVDPGAGCDNPSSVTYAKCVLWAGPVTSGNANNVGFTNDQFQVVIAGSNGYTSTGIVDPDGFTNRQYFGNGAIEGGDSFVGSTSFQGRFDAKKCASECAGHTAWAQGKPGERPCAFFNTYYQYVNDLNHIEGQQCVMYDTSFDSSAATNRGQVRGNDNYLITDSYGWSASS